MQTKWKYDSVRDTGTINAKELGELPTTDSDF